MASESSSTGATGEVSNDSTPPESRVSYCDFVSTVGLHPAEQTFDEGVIKNLGPDLYEIYSARSSTIPLQEVDEEERLKTFLRIRPSSRIGPEGEACLEVKDENTVVAYANRKNILSNVPKKHMEFKFSRVLGPSCGQSTIFEECVTPMIEKFMRNENCLIFSYGATNSGKTYTMQGHGTDYGVIPRTLDVIFSRYSDRHYEQANIRPHLYQSFHYLTPQEVQNLVEKRERIIADANIKGELMNSYRLTTSAFSDRSGVTVDFVGARQHDPTLSSTVYSVWVSYAELYNERVYDLLDNISIGKNKRRKELKLLQDRNGFVYIKDLTEIPVTSDEQAYKLFLAGRKNLQFAATQMNQNSSRSHSFFTIRVVSIGIENTTPYPKTVHRMTFCDLAGMERANQTENKGFRLQESGNINNSLTVLLKVIRLLREKQTNLPAHGMIETVPFRESKLTHIFKSYFTSATHICMVVNVNPDPAVADSTLQVLHNSAIASNVIVFRPVELNVQAIPYNGNGTSNLTPKQISSKPPLPPKNTSRKPVQEIPTTSDSSMESETESDDYQVPTVVAPKTYLQKLRRLEHENAFLRQRIIDMQREHEIEKERIINETMSTFAEERKTWRARLDKVRLVEENVSRRRLSLVKLEVSPRNSCGRCGPPVQDMDSIDETVEEVDEEKTENVSVGTENSCKQNGIKKSKIDTDSDKEN